MSLISAIILFGVYALSAGLGSVADATFLKNIGGLLLLGAVAVTLSGLSHLVAILITNHFSSGNLQARSL